jgi:addiction module HigA family antidote
MAESSRFIPEWDVAPGVVLAEALADRGWSQVELARRTARPIKTINEIINGKAAITPDTAIQFERATGIPARLWLNLERIHAENIARQDAQKELAGNVEWLEQFPVTDLIRHELLPRTRDKVVLLDALLRFLGASSPDAWQRQWRSMSVSLHRSPSYAPKPGALAAWLRWGEIESANLKVGHFDEERLRELLPAIRELTALDPIAFQAPLQKALADAGVLLVLTPELGGSRVSGAARWLDTGRPAVQLSLRHKTDDQFWFALLHELGHLLHGIRRRTYVDIASLPIDDLDEHRANEFARNALLEAEAYEQFVAQGAFDAKSVATFAKIQRVAAGIVVGRLQHERRIAQGRLGYLKRRLDWA